MLNQHQKEGVTITAPKKKYTRSVKCPLCNQDLDRNVEPFVEKSGRFLHAKCHNKQQAKTKPRRDLLEYICYLHKLSVPTGYILRQIKEFEERTPPFTLQGIHMTLNYFHEIKGNEVIEGTGIGIVEYVYEDARKYFIELRDVLNHNSNIKIDNTEEVIYVEPPKKRKIKQLNLEEIF